MTSGKVFFQTRSVLFLSEVGLPNDGYYLD